MVLALLHEEEVVHGVASAVLGVCRAAAAAAAVRNERATYGAPVAMLPPPIHRYCYCYCYCRHWLTVE